MKRVKEIFGAVKFEGKVFEDDTLALLRTKKVGEHGTDWTYEGDVPQEECNIVVLYSIDGSPAVISFDGPRGLNEFVQFIKTSHISLLVSE